MQDSPVSSTCTIQLPDGAFCEAVADARIGYAICVRHARHIYEDVDRLLNDDVRRAALASYDDALPSMRRRESVVYYVLVGDLIKIGKTVDIARRMTAYPPTAVLLATEPGGREVEAQRLAQFAHDRVARREWFDPSRQLRSYIESLVGYRAA